MTLFDYINDRKNRLHPHIETFIEQEIASSKVPYLTDALRKLQLFMQGGKMIRGVLVLLSAEMLGDADSSELFNASASIEFLHSSFLIHDDIMDNDLLRRGSPTIYAQYQQEADKKHLVNPVFYGQSMAICDGNIAQSLGYNGLAHASSNESIQSKLMEKFSSEINRVNGGQMQDFDYGASKAEPTAEQIIEMYRYKAARYTFSLPLVLGALLTETDTQTIHVLDQLGENLGIVFQIKDDEIELYSSEAEIGKPVGSDIRENKKTYVRALLLSNVTAEENQKIQKIFGNNSLDESDLEYIKHLLHSYEIDTQIKKTMQELSEQAKKAVQKINGDPQYKSILEELIEYNLTRTS